MNSPSFAMALALVAVPGVAAAQTPDYPPPPPPSAAQQWVPLRPQYFPYEEGSPVPPGARVVTRQRVALITTGASMFGTLWLVSALVGSLGTSFGEGASLWMIVPVIGPFGYAANVSHASTGDVVGLAINGLLQGAGLGMLIGGAVHPVRSLVFDRPAAPRWSLLPNVGGAPGASLRVVF